MRRKQQYSSLAYIVFGTLTIAASLSVGVLIFSSGLFKITAANHLALLLVGVVYGLSIFSIVALILKWQEAPERIMAAQSHQMLTVANQTLTFLRKGFSYESASHVAEIIYDATDVDALVVTDGKLIMAFAGSASEYHKPGDFAASPVRQRAVESGTMQPFSAKDETQCLGKGDWRWSGVTVPLKVSNRVIGTVDFLFLPPKTMTENRLAVASGLGLLLSTQLELAELDHQRQLAIQSELKALRAQINPHFLFNTLNTIAALCRSDPQTARRLIIKFAEFFRDSLERQSQFATLEEELNYVNLYLGFEQARFGSKLRVRREVAKEAMNVMLPSLIIQPLVENAIKHGMSSNGSLKVKLSARLDDGQLVVQVHDNGKGMTPGSIPKSAHQGSGIGLSNIRERLKVLYGVGNLMEIESEPGQGTTVNLKLPLDTTLAEASISDN